MKSVMQQVSFAIVLALFLSSTGSEAIQEQSALLQEYEKTLDTATSKTDDTPVTRVVKLLQEMQAELEAEIERLTALSAELNEKLKELEDELAKDKEELAEAEALRKKQLAEFHGAEVDSIQAIENLKAAIVVLGKHHGGAFPQLTLMTLNQLTKHTVSVKAHKNPSNELQLERFMDHN